MFKSIRLISFIILMMVAAIAPGVNAQAEPIACVAGTYDGIISGSVYVYDNGTPFPVGTQIDYVFNVVSGTPSSATFDGSGNIVAVIISEASTPISGTYTTTNPTEQRLEIRDNDNGSVDYQYSINGGCNLPGAVLSDGDPDGDGIRSSKDNCPFDFNPDQEDGWGSGAGDLCDTDWYNRTGIGIAGFTQKDGVFNLHGNCIYLADGDPRCPVIARLDPNAFVPGDMPMDVATVDAGTWSVVLYYLHSNNGADVYQVNIYSTNPPQPDTLLDDRLEFYVNNGIWRWYQRGGSRDF